MMHWMDGSLRRSTFKLYWYLVAAVPDPPGAGEGEGLGSVLLTDGVLRLCGVIVCGMAKRIVKSD
jgi:hypothetical protein